MARFRTHLWVDQVNENDWQLLAPLVFESDVLSRQIMVPLGFVTDFASVPRLPFIYWFTGGTAQAPAVLHDYFYRTGTEDVTRAQADALLAEAMEAQGYWKVRTWAMWAGVRLGGRWSFRSRSKSSTTTFKEWAQLTGDK